MKNIFTLALLFVCISVCADDWLQFRGPNNDGIVPPPANGESRDLPIEIGDPANVKWETAIHDHGWCTPVIMGEQIWLTSATEDGKDMFVFCVDKETGKIVFEKKIFHNEKPRPLGNDVNTYASPSSIIEKGRVYVHFGSYGTACIDTKSFETLWERRDLPCNHYRGPASSPLIYNDLLILTMDGSDLQYQVALNKMTGKTVWKTDRNSNFRDLDANGQPKTNGDFRKGFSTPIVFEQNGQPQMVISVSYDVFSYDPRTGKELWRVDHGSYSNASMAMYGNGLVYAITGRRPEELYAIDPSGRGNITETNVKWVAKRGLPSMPSPILKDGLIYSVNNGGVATCIDALTGKDVWRERVKGHYYASPIYADGNLYYFSDSGNIIVVKPGREFNVIAQSDLGDGFMASPAVSGKAFYLRSKSYLYRIEK